MKRICNIWKYGEVNVSIGNRILKVRRSLIEYLPKIDSFDRDISREGKISWSERQWLSFTNGGLGKSTLFHLIGRFFIDDFCIYSNYKELLRKDL